MCHWNGYCVFDDSSACPLENPTQATVAAKRKYPTQSWAWKISPSLMMADLTAGLMNISVSDRNLAGVSDTWHAFLWAMKFWINQSLGKVQKIIIFYHLVQHTHYDKKKTKQNCVKYLPGLLAYCNNLSNLHTEDGSYNMTETSI